jgi:glycosyltransferase involved in cell wall biosynthesis
MLVDIVICTYNRSKLLKICLDALLPQFTSEFQEIAGVLVIDNNCQDDTQVVVKETQRNYPFVRYLRESKQGTSHAKNRAVIASEAEYLCYLDDDAKPSENYVQTLAQVLNGKRPDFAGGPILPYYLIDKPQWFRDELEIRRHSNTTGFVDCWISGGNFVVRRKLLDVPKEKMRIWYRVRRSYQSGKTSVKLRNEPTSSLLKLSLRMIRESMGLVFTFIKSGLEADTIDKLRMCSLLAGKVSQHVKNVLPRAG